MSTLIEDYLIFHLQHEMPIVKWTAARTLAQYGTARARTPLEEAYDYFHEYWKGREAELGHPGYRDGSMLETSLRTAIARGNAWFTDEEALRKLAADCMTASCRMEGQQDLAQWAQKPLRITIAPAHDGYGWEGHVAHYPRLQGMDAVQQKLSQFPKGTRFSLQVLGPGSEQDRITSELRQSAAQSGLVIE